MTRQGFPAATTPSGTLRATTLPAPMTLPAPIRTPLRMTARAPMNTSSSITTVSSGDVSGGGAYRRGIASTGWKSVSTTATSAPRSTRFPIRMPRCAQRVVPLIPTSEPTMIEAPAPSVRMMTGRATPSAVALLREIRTDRAPMAILEPGAISMIGRPRTRTDGSRSTPLDRATARHTKPSPVSATARRKSTAAIL